MVYLAINLPLELSIHVGKCAILIECLGIYFSFYGHHLLFFGEQIIKSCGECPAAIDGVLMSNDDCRCHQLLYQPSDNFTWRTNPVNC